MAGRFFKRRTRSTRDYAGAFEYDGETAYFYLWKGPSDPDSKITGCIHVLTGAPDFHKGDIEIRWNADETMVGLFIRQQLWAAFDSTSEEPYGGDYRANADPILPMAVASSFRRH